MLDYSAAGSEVAPHLSSTGQDLDVVGGLLNDYRAASIDRLVVLRGDTPPGRKNAAPKFFAQDLVEYVRRHSAIIFTSR